MVDVEQRLRDLLTDDHLAVRIPAEAVETVHLGVRRRRRRARLANTAGVVAVAVAVAAIVGPTLLSRTQRTPPGSIAGGKSGVWTRGPITSLPSALTKPQAMAVSGGTVWIAGPAARAVDGDVLARVDATSRQVTTMRHLWVALRDPSGNTGRCSLQLRQTIDGGIVSTSSLPCNANTATGPAVTANGEHAWVATDEGTSTDLRLYTAGSRVPTKERVLPGGLGGPHVLVIGGTSVYVITLSPNGAVLHQLSHLGLEPLSTIAVPNARLMAFGSGRIYVADTVGVASFPADLSGRSTFTTGDVTTLTTGAGVVWCDADGGALAGLDPRTAAVTGVVEVPADPRGIVRADGDVLWAVRVDADQRVVVQSAAPAP
jgi:hypothetical protein